MHPGSFKICYIQTDLMNHTHTHTHTHTHIYIYIYIYITTACFVEHDCWLVGWLGFMA